MPAAWGQLPKGPGTGPGRQLASRKLDVPFPALHLCPLPPGLILGVSRMPFPRRIAFHSPTWAFVQ